MIDGEPVVARYIDPSSFQEIKQVVKSKIRAAENHSFQTFESSILDPTREVCQAPRWRLRLRLNRNAILTMTLVSLVHFKIHRAFILTMLIYIVL